MSTNATQPKPVSARANDAVAVPPGYKQTEVGLIPEDWDVSLVGNEFRIQLGKMLDAAKNVGIQKPYIGNRAVQWGRVVVDDLSLVAMTPSDLQRFRLQLGDLLVCEGGEIGRAAIWDSPIADCYYQKALHRLRSRRGYDAFLMMYLLQLWASSGHLANYVTQTSIAHLAKDKLEQVPVPVPPPREQHAIAEALSDVDSLIEALDKLIAKKRAIKQAAMQQLLTGKTRLPGFGKNAGYKDTEVGVIPEDWSAKRLGDISHIKTGKKNNEDKVEDGEYPFFVRSAKVERIDTYSFEGEAILVPGEGGIGDISHYIDGRFDFHQRVYKISHFPDDVCGKFVYYCMAMCFGLHATRNTVKATVDSLRLPTFQNFVFPFAQHATEQRAIVTVLSDMDAEVAALESRRDKTKAIKQGMMQALLTGRIRLDKPKVAKV